MLSLKMISKKVLYNTLSYVFEISYFKYVSILVKNNNRKANNDARVNVIDLGCGEGAVTKSIAQMFPESNCIGVDLIQTNSSHNNLTFVHDDILNYLSITDLDECSLVIMNDVIEHFDRKEIIKILDIVIDKVPKGCYLCLQFPNMSSPFGLRNYFGDHTHKTALTDTRMSGILSRYNQIAFHFNGVEEVRSFSLISLLFSFIYWKCIIKISGLVFRGSIGWNKYFFYPNLFCIVQKL